MIRIVLHIIGRQWIGSNMCWCTAKKLLTHCRCSAVVFPRKFLRTSSSRCLRDVAQSGTCVWWWTHWRDTTAASALSHLLIRKEPQRLSDRLPAHCYNASFYHSFIHFYHQICCLILTLYRSWIASSFLTVLLAIQCVQEKKQTSVYLIITPANSIRF